MAERYVYRYNKTEMIYEKILTEFEWAPGFSVSQKQKSIKNLHQSYLEKYHGDKLLEISTKSAEPIGIALSAFNLKVSTKKGQQFSVEQLFQSGKVFRENGPQQYLLEKGLDARELKKIIRQINETDELIAFSLFGNLFPLEPKTFFYNWLYIQALYLHKKLSNDILKYNAFTDIELNHKKSFNSQAEACSIFIWLVKTNQIEKALSSKESFKQIVYKEY
ncbi:hypothetical protein ROU88_08315 [Macrococcus capreoli]